VQCLEWKRALVLDVSPPICVRSIWQASALRHRSPASVTESPVSLEVLAGFRFGWGLGREGKGFANSYLCGDNVKLESLPVVVGLFECLNLSLRNQIIWGG